MSQRREFIEYSSIIRKVLNYKEIVRGSLRLVKFSIELIDGSILHGSEVYVASKLEKYGYYWFDPQGNLRIGWNNAPHHYVRTFPHHKHIGRKNYIRESSERSLSDVLSFIEKRLRSKTFS